MNPAWLAGAVAWSALMLGAQTAFPQNPIIIDQVRIVVNNKMLTARQVAEFRQARLEEARRRFPAQELAQQLARLEQDLIEELVENLLLEERAEELAIRVSDQELADRVRAIVAAQPDIERAYSSDELKDLVLRDTLKRRVIQREVLPYLHVGEDRLRQACLRELTENREIKVGHVLVRGHDEQALQRIQAIRQRLEQGAPFEEVARTYSQDPSVLQNQGILGYIAKGQFMKPFEDMAFSMAIGELSPPVETELGYHLIKVFDERPAKVIDCDRLPQPERDRYYAAVFAELQEQRLTEYLAKLKAKASIKVFD